MSKRSQEKRRAPGEGKGQDGAADANKALIPPPIDALPEASGLIAENTWWDGVTRVAGDASQRIGRRV